MATPELVGLGCESAVFSNVKLGPLWEAMVVKIKRPDLFLPVTNVVTEDRDGFVYRSMHMTALGGTIREHIYANEKLHEIRFVVLNEDNTESDHEHINKLHILNEAQTEFKLEYYQRKTGSAGAQSDRIFWKVPADTVRKAFVKTIEMANKTQ